MPRPKLAAGVSGQLGGLWVVLRGSCRWPEARRGIWCFSHFSRLVREGVELAERGGFILILPKEEEKEKGEGEERRGGNLP